MGGWKSLHRQRTVHSGLQHFYLDWQPNLYYEAVKLNAVGVIFLGFIVSHPILSHTTLTNRSTEK